ncbi:MULTISPECIES: MarR family winged helix-turn-helix transcriptional regulator [unclassified Bacillus (in: firmicutes)]|uniref:MarR family winged helix-turn-helix transcriptional regulator n=1 Tax=unclassified Bacillus (in: firmicutes) TaxID=185979 RepID=UPI0008EE5604|nr:MULTISPECIES: MarR family transcriptional regulator [unclassified Bacillus (in: firmicutes)]SFB06627.1 DNA-binding transcriptional regulator, MarR family [Bacillus sp. UNCCL13]SFQ87628.1 DNA-binding transcriptional regulator, MarR family [Bacillus sp. cl95]
MERLELEKQFATGFRKLTKMSRSEFLQILDQYIPFNEFLILKILANQDHSMVSQIAERLEVTNSHVTAASEKLVNKGFIVRTRSEQDRRIVYLSITEDGKNLVQKMENIIQEYFKRKLQGLKDEEILLGIQIFNKILGIN